MNIQTRIGDFKNQLKQLQEVNLAQIDRIQNLLEKNDKRKQNVKQRNH